MFIFENMNKEYIYGSIGDVPYGISKYCGKVNNNTFESLKYSGGVSIQFVSNSPEIIIQCKFTDVKTGHYPHVGISARQGLSIAYALCDGDNTQWYNINCYQAKDNIVNFKISMGIYIDDNVLERPYRLAIYGPILSTIQLYRVGINLKSWIKPDYNISRKNSIVMLGGVNTYGIGITTSAYICSNILKRHLNRDIYNLGLDTLNIYDQAIIDIIEKIKPKLVVWECQPTRIDKHIILKCFPQFINYLKNYNLIISLNFFSKDLELVEMVEKYVEIFHNIQVLYNDDIFKTDIEREYASYSPNFINDYGQVIYAKRIEEIIINKNF